MTDHHEATPTPPSAEGNPDVGQTDGVETQRPEDALRAKEEEMQKLKEEMQKLKEEKQESEEDRAKLRQLVDDLIKMVEEQNRQVEIFMGGSHATAEPASAEVDVEAPVAPVSPESFMRPVAAEPPPGGGDGREAHEDEPEEPSIYAIFRERIRPALEVLDVSREQMAEAAAGWPRAIGFLNINANFLRKDHGSYVDAEVDWVIKEMESDPEVHNVLRALGHNIPASGSPEATSYTKQVFGRDGIYRELRQIAYNIDSTEREPVGAFQRSKNKNNSRNAFRNLGRSTTVPGIPNERSRNLPRGRGRYGANNQGT